MPLERLLQVHLAALAALSTLLLSVGQRDALWPALALAGAALSVCLTDTLGVLRLHRGVANLAAVAALVICLRGFSGAGSHAQLMAIANLLIYMQFVLLFQQKSIRIYWQLFVLSLLQVVVAGALRQELLFGLLLGVYLMVALAALTLFHLHRMAAREGLRTDAGTEGFRPLFGFPWLRLVGAMSLGAAAVAALVFVSAPRRAAQAWHRGATRAHPAAPFSDQVRIGDEFGEIRLGRQVVARAAFYERTSGRSIRLAEGPYLRGATLASYHPTQHVWQFDRANHDSWQVGPARGEAPVRQEIALAPIESASLLGVEPFVRLPQTPGAVLLAAEPQRLMRDLQRSNPLQGEFRYALGTTGIAAGRQKPLAPHGNPARSVDEQIRMRRQWQRLTEFDEERLAPLRQLSEEALAAAQAAPDEPYQAAKALEAHLRASGLYRYTLDFRALPGCPADVDPAVHFIARLRAGHCELYASALTLMLRSQNIPARLVSGYYASEYNELGRYYQVRQSDAHTWVEAWLLPEQIPPALRDNREIGPAGAWLRLDPTPPDPSAAGPARLPNRAAQAWDHFELLWGDYVLGLNGGQQRASIYLPARDWLARRLAGPEQKWESQEGIDYPALLKRWLLAPAPSWRAASLALASLTAIMVAAWLARRVIRWMRRQDAGRPEESSPLGDRAALSAQQQAASEAFRSVERLLADRLRLSRRVDQTPGEFLVEAALRFPETSRAPGILQRLASAYHEARFGAASAAHGAVAGLATDLAALICDEQASDPPALPGVN